MLEYAHTLKIQDKKRTSLPLNRSASGYGNKIPTQYMLKINKRWHRVYTRIFSNIGTSYIISQGKEYIVLDGDIYE